MVNCFSYHRCALTFVGGDNVINETLGKHPEEITSVLDL